MLVQTLHFTDQEMGHEFPWDLIAGSPHFAPRRVGESGLFFREYPHPLTFRSGGGCALYHSYICGSLRTLHKRLSVLWAHNGSLNLLFSESLASCASQLTLLTCLRGMMFENEGQPMLTSWDCGLHSEIFWVPIPTKLFINCLSLGDLIHLSFPLWKMGTEIVLIFNGVFCEDKWVYLCRGLKIVPGAEQVFNTCWLLLLFPSIQMSYLWILPDEGGVSYQHHVVFSLPSWKFLQLSCV